MNPRQSISRSSSNSTVEIVIHGGGEDGNAEIPNERNGSGKLHSPSGSRTISPSNSFALPDKQSPFSFRSDFILISEFSELDGPVPLFVIPETGSGTFNKDDFVVKVMAVDHQTKSTDPANFSEDSLRDTQVVIAYPQENAHAYVHHFTLLDVFARGYVRPLAVSYITHDSKKIMSHFPEFLESFSKISNSMKSANREIFKHDLALRIADAEHTHQAVLQSKEPEAVLPAPNTVSEYMNDLKQLHKKLNKSQESLEASSETSTNIKELNVNQLGEVQEYQPQLIHSIAKNAYFHKKSGLRTLDELCGEGIEKARAQLNLAYVHFSRPSIVLSLEKEDEMVMFPSSSMLSMGKNILLNFNVVADKRSRHLNPESIITPKGTQSTPVPTTKPFTVGTVSFSSSSTGSSVGSFGSLSSTPSQPNEATKEKESEEVKENITNSNENNAILNPADHLSIIGLVNAQHQAILKDPTFQLESFGSTLWGFSSNFHGHGISDFRHRYSHAKNIVFSLLKGRTVVITASPQNEIPVRRMIGTLSLFVPGHWGKHPNIVPWMTRPFKITDLPYIKLVGISKAEKSTSAVPKAIERYITLFDYESETVTTVPYSGQIVDEMLNMQKRWPDEETLLAHIHQQLYELGCTASLYYHLCCIGVTPPNGDKNGDPEKKSQSQEYDDTLRHISFQVIGQSKFSTSVDLPNDQQRQIKMSSEKKSLSDSNLGVRSVLAGAIRETNKETFFRQMNIHEGDVEIIEYLTEVVKQQQLLEMHGTEYVAPPCRLDYSKCTFLMNTVKHKRLSSS